MKAFFHASSCALLALACASPAAAQLSASQFIPDTLLLEILAPARDACAEAGGQFGLESDAIVPAADFNGDGVPDVIVPASAFSCSTPSAFFTDRGGPLAVLVSTGDPTAPWARHDLRAHGHQVAAVPDGSGAQRPVLLLTHRGAGCGASGLDFCVGAYFWGVDPQGEGRFFSLAGLERE